jgi:hypothetical protein
MIVSIPKALLAAALLPALLAAPPAAGKDVYKPYLDAGIPHHAAILDTLARIEKTPKDAELHNDLGCLVAWDGFWRDALRSFDTAADLAPKDSRPRFNAGLVRVLRGEWRGARSSFRKAVKVDPGNWAAWWMLGLAEESLGNDESAVAAYSKSLRVDTSLFDPKVNPFAVASQLKARVLLETYERRRVDAGLPFSNQLAAPSRVASFFQTVPKASEPVVAEAPVKSGPVVTRVPPPGPAVARPGTPTFEPTNRRRRAYSARGEREGRAPAPATEVPPPGPDFGEGSGAPGTGARPGPGVNQPGTVAPPRRTGTPGPGGAPEPTPPPTDKKG